MNDRIPLAPSKTNLRSNDPVFATINHQKPRPEIRSSKSLVYILAVIVVVCAAILVFALVVMRPASPRARLDLVLVRNLAQGNSSSSPFFNITLQAELAVENKNFGRFDFDNTAASFLYGGVVVGEAKLGRGRVRARGTARVNVTVEVRSGGLDSEVSRNMSSDISSDGVLKLRSYGELRGRVHLIKLVKKKTAVLNCSMSLNTTSRSIEDLICS